MVSVQQISNDHQAGHQANIPTASRYFNAMKSIILLVLPLAEASHHWMNQGMLKRVSGSRNDAKGCFVWFVYQNNSSVRRDYCRIKIQVHLLVLSRRQLAWIHGFVGCIEDVPRFASLFADAHDGTIGILQHERRRARVNGGKLTLYIRLQCLRDESLGVSSEPEPAGRCKAVFVVVVVVALGFHRVFPQGRNGIGKRCTCLPSTWSGLRAAHGSFCSAKVNLASEQR